jgi:thioredoxin reductase
MTIDTPARLAVLGAGPIGLEAALYARFLGYDVIIIEQGGVAEHVLRWGHVTMLTPFGQNASPLGLKALLAQDERYRPPAADEYLTGRQWAERYLLPLAETDLLAGHFALQTRVVGVGKEQVLKTDREADLPPGDERGDWSFRLLLRDAAGNERIEMVDGVLDCTGVYSQPNYAGHGGLPAVGETGLREAIIYHLPDILGADRALFADQSTLLIGDGLSAATAAIWLAELKQQVPATQFTWITRHEQQPVAGPIAVIENDPLSARSRLAVQANEVAQQQNCWHWGTHLERIAREGDGAFRVELSGQLAGEFHFARVLALVGYRPERQVFEELQIAVCPVTGGVVSRTEPIQGEANYYILGSKAWGRSSDFLFRDGLTQIRAAFAIIGDRPNLDLYAAR